MPLPKNKAWFPLKTYGYGWGLPSKWQGWLAMGLYVVAMIVAGIRVSPKHPGWFLIYAFATTSLFIGLCYWKGEDPRWQGKKHEGENDKSGPYRS